MSVPSSSVLFVGAPIDVAVGVAVTVPIPEPTNGQGAGWARANVLSVIVEAVTGSGVLSLTPVWDGAVDAWVDYGASPLVAVPSTVDLTVSEGDRCVLELRNPGARASLAFRLAASGGLSGVRLQISGRS